MATRQSGAPEMARPQARSRDLPRSANAAGAGSPHPWARLVRHVDLALLALALPLFLVAGLPALGWLAAAVAWVSQRAIRHAFDRRAAASDDPRTVAGLVAGSMLLRGWLVALTILGGGLIEREAGLSGAVLVIVLFTAFFATQLARRPFDAGVSA